MERPTDLGHLKTNEWDMLQELADRFERSWREAESVDLTKFLPAVGESLRAVALEELIKTELEIRWRRNQKVLLEEYIQRFPELGGQARISPRLLYEEYRVRHLHGDHPALDEYRTRFPAQFERMQQLIREQPLPTISKASPTPPSPTPPMDQPPVLPRVENSFLPGGGGYNMVRRIGTGGFAEVWQAEAPGGVKVAIKIPFRTLDHEEAQRELRSLELIKNLNHPFLLATHTFWIHEGRLHIVMELAEKSLRERYKECKRQGLPGIPLAELLRYFHESAEAIDYLHSEHVLHRDIKPDNILLLRNYAKVADFGLAREQQQQHMISVSGSGTPAYMAPEVWRGKASEQSDCYSLALTYVEMRLGRRPFGSSDYMGVMMDHLESRPELSPLAESEQRVLQRALAKDPAQRFATCVEFIESLQQALAGELGKATVGGGASVEDSLPTITPPSGQEVAPPASPYDTIGARRSPEAPDLEPTDVDLLKPFAPIEPPRRSWMLPVGLLLAVALLAAVGGIGYRFLVPSNSPPEVEKPIGPGPGPITSVKDDKPIPSIVVKKEPEPVLPADCEKAPKAEEVKADGHRYYNRIVLNRHGLRVAFVLVPHLQEDDPPTFYIMENKVSNEQFRKFVTESPVDIVKSEWQRGGQRGGKDMGSLDGRLPVLRVTVEEALRFAEWLGGQLPTVKQWDRAAGYDQRGQRAGPFDEPADPTAGPRVAVNRVKEGPMQAGDAGDDISSPFRIHDLAGNGREWTRDLTDGRTVPITDALRDDLVILRGRSYTSLRPLTYADLDYEQKVPQTQYYHRASPFTGFRVVLIPPE